jgi:hypothetical protein
MEGRYAELEGSTFCRTCPMSTFAVDNVACMACPEGFDTLYAGSAREDECLPQEEVADELDSMFGRDKLAKKLVSMPALLIREQAARKQFGGWTSRRRLHHALEGIRAVRFEMLEDLFNSDELDKAGRVDADGGALQQPQAAVLEAPQGRAMLQYGSADAGGRHLSQYGRHLSQYGRHLSQYGRHLSQYGRHLSQYGRHLSQYSRHLSEQDGVEEDDAPARHLSQYGRGGRRAILQYSGGGRRLAQYSRHLAQYSRRLLGGTAGATRELAQYGRRLSQYSRKLLQYGQGRSLSQYRPARRLSQYGRRLSQYGRRLSQYGGRHLAQYGRHLSQYGRKLAQYGRRHLSQYGRRLSQYSRHLLSGSRHLSQYSRRLTSRAESLSFRLVRNLRRLFGL